uniref:Saccharopine dehydrogenase NADP binding domain-containing protein n=1 Tax=Chrysotila carterae TaxID=13221 RepID=A0A7S4B4P6_CHRCT
MLGVRWSPEVLEAPSDDDAALRSLASSTKVVLSTAGPYELCGTPLLRACIAEGTDYVDINGEVPWMRAVAAQYDEAAAAAGVHAVLSCGFSAPSDLGALFAVRALQRKHDARLGVDGHSGAGCVAGSVSKSGGDDDGDGESSYGGGGDSRTFDVASVRALLQFNGRLSGGTMATGLLLDHADARAQAVRREAFALGGAPLHVAGGLRPIDAEPTHAELEQTMGVWAAPFWMSSISSRVVRRSHELFRQAAATDPAAVGYGADFGYREMAFARDETVANAMARETPSTEQRERLIARGRLPAPGQGPSAETRARSFFRTFVLAQGSNGEYAFVTTSGGDPGYEETSKIVAEAALQLASRRHELPLLRRRCGHGGVLTPAYALGMPFIRQLQARGIAFEQHDVDAARLPALVSALAAQRPPHSRCAALAVDV